jgi:alanine-glyoxylate transaminase/serine-glyoxylate transaminase/serine-pyruvate transaminase
MDKHKSYHHAYPSRRILMGPGPSDIHPRVLNAMAMPVLGHLDPEFVDIMDEVKEMLRCALQTSNRMTYVISGPGSAGMESSLMNVLEPGDNVAVCKNGVFGGRMEEICRRIGAHVTTIEAQWGEAIDPANVKSTLESTDFKALAIVHAETSTGVLQPLEEISRMVKDAGVLLIVDAVTSFCGAPIETDNRGIDVLYSGSQKCLSAPPGLSPTTFSPKALEVAINRKTPMPSWFLDVRLLESYWSGAKRAYHHTAPVSAIYALREALRIVLEEGLEERYARHARHAAILQKGLEQRGFQVAVRPEHRLPMLTVVEIPEGVDDREVRSRLLNEYNIEIGGGLGKFSGKVWRIGLMGESSTLNNINALLGALDELCDL